MAQSLLEDEMGKYGAFRAGIIAALSTANWVLETVAGNIADVIEASWGGEATASTSMRTRIARDSAIGTGSRTDAGVQELNMRSTANLAFCSTTYLTLQPTIVSGALFGTSWNAHGGVIRWLAAPGEELNIYDAGATTASLECRHDAQSGATTSSYHVIWQEP